MADAASSRFSLSIHEGVGQKVKLASSFSAFANVNLGDAAPANNGFFEL